MATFFDGAGDALRIGDWRGLNSATNAHNGSCTFVGWAKIDNLTITHDLMVLNDNTTTDEMSLRLDGFGIGDPVRFRKEHNLNGVIQADSGTYVSDEWTHCAGTIRHGKEIFCWKNGGERATDSDALSLNSNETNQLCIASEFISGPDFFDEITLAELGIWDTELTEHEIKLLALRRYSPELLRPSSLRFYWSGRRPPTRGARNEAWTKQPFSLHGNPQWVDHKHLGIVYPRERIEFAKAPVPSILNQNRMSIPGVGRPFMRSQFPETAKTEAWRHSVGLTFSGNLFAAAAAIKDPLTRGVVPFLR